MTALENYSIIIDSIFNEGTTTFDTSKKSTNSVIGALNHPNEFEVFKANFIARLKRLKQIYNNHPSHLQQIITQVNLIADKKNWEGAYAELSAYDLLNQSSLLINPIEPNVDVDKSKAFALELGKSEANLDGFIEDFGVYFDVKCFKDNVTEILIGIYKDVESFFGFEHVPISEEYALDISYDDFQHKRNDILKEIKNKFWEEINRCVTPFSLKYSLDITQDNFKNKIKGLSPELKAELLIKIQDLKITSFKSTVINDFSFKIMWSKGVLSALRTYDPFRHATNYHKIVFNYVNKFLKDEPTLIVLVSFPWYNLVVTDFSMMDKTMFRALTRRVFCQFKHDPTLFSTFNSKFRGTQTINEISNNLSGIIFLKDNAILGENPDSINVKSYIYLNPNAKNPLTDLSIDYLQNLKNNKDFIDYDNFKHDNY